VAAVYEHEHVRKTKTAEEIFIRKTIIVVTSSGSYVSWGGFAYFPPSCVENVAARVIIFITKWEGDDRFSTFHQHTHFHSLSAFFFFCLLLGGKRGSER
jgi:hypothetical protein